MNRKSAVLGSCLALGLGVSGCGDPATSPGSMPAASQRPQAVISVDGGSGLGAARLPSSVRLTDQSLGDLTRRAIDPTQYVCPASTPWVDWYIARAREVVAENRPGYVLLTRNLQATIIPTYEAALFQTRDTPQTFGYDGEYTTVMLKTERDVKRFWDIASDDIQLIGMHGTVLLDTERVAKTYEALFGLDAGTAAAVAALVKSTVVATKTLNGGNHPLFSFNAFALTTFGGEIPDKIVMGDGVLAGFEAIGFGDVAPKAVYAHEFAHHIQFENGYFEDAIATAGTPPEQTRYTELMADAMGAYYLTHSRGAAMNRKRVEDFLQVFFQIGDCGYTDPGHHGTPNQRMAAARFGFELAAEAQKQGHILPSETVYARFLARYPALIAPDAPVASIAR